MIGLRGVRVLLVDDSLDEALPVIKAFAKKGIPLAYFDGNINDLPTGREKLKGVRLAILDMDLGGTGDTPDNKISTLIARLQAILAIDNGPYTMIAWTKHAELVDLLGTKLFALYKAADKQEDRVPLPVVCIRFEKIDFRTGADFDIAKLSSCVETELKRSIPLGIMQTWEEKCLRAATGVTNSLSDMIATQDDDLASWRESWNKGYLGVLISLAREEIGDDNLSNETFLKALFGALNPLHVDFLETDHAPLPDLPDGIITQPERGARASNPLAGKINTKLHISFENVDLFQPGNIYKLADCGHVLSLQPKVIFEHFVQDEHKENEGLFNQTVPVLLEVSASCDYAQNKIKLTKFLAGLIVPQIEIKKFKLTGGAILSLNPLWIKEQDCCIMLSSQHLISLELNRAKKLKVFARLRSQWLVNVQFWLGQQISRPGVVMLK
ncbi:MAG: hypothetical protein ABSB41_02160 [Anaerolineales bacterium]